MHFKELGHVVARDLTSFFKYDNVDSTSAPNPLGVTHAIEKTYNWGRSQTGRAIRDGLCLGFNNEVKSRQLFDDVIPHLADAGRMWLNQRFAFGSQPSRSNV